LRSFGYVLAGTIEALPKGFTLERVEYSIMEFVCGVNEVVLD